MFILMCHFVFRCVKNNENEKFKKKSDFIMKLDVGNLLGFFVFVVGFLTKYGNFAGNFLVGEWQP